MSQQYRKLSEHQIVRDLAEALGRRLVSACIRDLQRMRGDVLLSGDFSGLRNVWDEICVQQRCEHSFFWQAYLHTIDTFIAARLEDLQPYELDALWLLTREGGDWAYEDEDRGETYPVLHDQVLTYLRDQVLTQALEWSNDRISRYLERSYDRD